MVDNSLPKLISGRIYMDPMVRRVTASIPFLVLPPLCRTASGSASPLGLAHQSCQPPTVHPPPRWRPRRLATPPPIVGLPSSPFYPHRWPSALTSDSWTSLALIYRTTRRRHPHCRLAPPPAPPSVARCHRPLLLAAAPANLDTMRKTPSDSDTVRKKAIVGLAATGRPKSFLIYILWQPIRTNQY
jgi:hypothetical protein